MPVLEFARAALPTFFTVLAIVYMTRLAAGRARFGAPLDAVGRPGTVQHMTHSLFRVFRIAIWMVCVLRAIWPDFDEMLGVFPAMMTPGPVMVGLVLLVTGFGWVGYCHNYMGLEWRSGVPERATPDLITSGPFSRVRNPMFIGVMLAQIGFFFALPSLFSLVCLVLGTIAVLAQGRFEEEELSHRLGETYSRYRDSTPAWIPRAQQRNDEVPG